LLNRRPAPARLEVNIGLRRRLWNTELGIDVNICRSEAPVKPEVA
jgi:hypothetical protein